ncbi:MAG: Na/Pi cotransporter family protein [Clostridia bacterium]|nr:Na/Pi cotransporter family protein [Clostridia bacterium]
MDIFDILTLLGGLCLFLFGMNLMGMALERRAGSKLQDLLSRLTSNRFVGFLTGMAITAVIQSSSATTVMVVGFVNSGLMTLKQATGVIMGANVGTTITAWILSLGGINGASTFLKLLKPSSFTPVLALIGIIYFMFAKGNKKKDTGTILLGFAVLMYGMDTMSDAVSGLANVPEFQKIFLAFQNPILGVIVGAVLTAIIQSSSASVGILQALSSTGAVTFGAAVPIIMGQNIGTCVTAMLSSVGTNRNAKRAALIHLFFNVIGTIVWLTVFSVFDMIFAPAFLDTAATHLGIAVVHTMFKVACTLLLFPMASLLEKLAYKFIPETDAPEKIAELDERLLATPAVALERCNSFAIDMAGLAVESLKNSIKCLVSYSPELAAEVREAEDKTDHYEDIIGTYLVKLSALQISNRESRYAAKLLHAIGDYERISDHAVNLVESAEEMKEKKLKFSDAAIAELKNLAEATIEILDLSYDAFIDNDLEKAMSVEPLEQIIDRLKFMMRMSHTERVQQSQCSIETGFVWSDILTNLERTSDHCSNIAGCVIDTHRHNMNLHESLRKMKEDDPEYKARYEELAAKYLN